MTQPRPVVVAITVPPVQTLPSGLSLTGPIVQAKPVNLSVVVN